MKLIMENWREFISEAEDEAFGVNEGSITGQEQVGKKLAAKAVRNINKLSQEDKEALEKLQKLLPALVMAAADAPELNEPIGEAGLRGSGRKGAVKRQARQRRKKLLKLAGLPEDAELEDLDAEQRRKYDEQVEILRSEKYMSIEGDGGQASLLLTKLDELPGIKRIPGITAALTALFQTDDLTILSAIEALSSITGPLGI